MNGCEKFDRGERHGPHEFDRVSVTGTLYLEKCEGFPTYAGLVAENEEQSLRLANLLRRAARAEAEIVALKETLDRRTAVSERNNADRLRAEAQLQGRVQ